MFGINGWATVQIFLIICISSRAMAQSEDLCANNRYSDICHKLGEHYYLIDTNNTLNWFEAERFCHRQNGFLANPRNATEMDHITDYLLAHKLVLGNDGVWLGGNDLGSEGTFYATENSELMPYARWRYTEPNNTGGDENCVHLWNYDDVLLMNDNDCTKEFFYMCQLRGKDPVELNCNDLLDSHPI